MLMRDRQNLLKLARCSAIDAMPEEWLSSVMSRIFEPYWQEMALIAERVIEGDRVT